MADKHWILDSSGNATTIGDIIAWANWFESSGEQRIVARDNLSNGVLVSTVFLGIDHQFGDGPPLLWETMIFGGPFDESTWRYSSLADAVDGHKAAVAKASKEL